jgi:hypothetical protein
MHAFEIFTALTLLSTAQAFRAPDDAPNGIYAFGYDDAGAETYTKVADIADDPHGFQRPPPASALLPSRLARRDWGSSSINSPKGVNCLSDGALLDVADISRATQVLAFACEGMDSSGQSTNGPYLEIPKHEGRLAVYGGAQVFICNMSDDDKRCWGETVSEYIDQVVDTCTGGGGKSFHARAQFGNWMLTC